MPFSSVRARRQDRCAGRQAAPGAPGPQRVADAGERVRQGRKFMSCSHCQELCQQAGFLLIGCKSVNNQSEARTAS